MEDNRLLEMTFGELNAEVFAFKGIIREYSTEELHVHPYHQVLLIKNGISLLVDEKYFQPLTGNRAAFIPADIPHRSTVIGSAVNFLNLFIRKNLFSTDIETVHIFKISRLGEALLERMNEINFIDLTNGFSGDCFRLFMNILSEDLSAVPEYIKLPEPHNETAIRIVQFIKDNYRKKLTMSDFERAIPFTSRHFSRLFSDELGITIFEYLRLYRICMASVRLFESDMRITDIAFEVGYESLSIFYRDFTRYYGVSPKKMRNRPAR